MDRDNADHQNESNDSSENVSCTTKFISCTTPTSETSKSSKAPPVTPIEMKKVSDNDVDQVSVGFSSGASDLLDYHASNPELESKSLTNRKLKRSKSIKQSIAHNTLDFFGVADEIITQNRKQKWDQRRLRHFSRWGKIKENLSSATTPDMTDGGSRFANIVLQAQALQHQQSTVSTKSTRKQNAATLLWKTASRQLSTKPHYEVSTIQSYGGRSFAPADLLDDDISVFGSSVHLDDRFSRSATPTPLPTPSMMDEHTFFHFDTFHPSTIDEENSFDQTDGSAVNRSAMKRSRSEDELSSPSASASPNIVKKWDLRLGPEPMITQAGVPKSRPHYMRQPSERRNRLHTVTQPIKRVKRQLGKGLVGNLLNRTFRRRIDSSVVKQMEDIPDHRPYFTYWISFVQIVILIVMVSVYPFAPVGVSQRQVKGDILVSRNGVLQKESVARTLAESFWVGPTLETLILLGAKYAPCMRRDKLIFEKLDEERSAENRTGCCMQTMNSGCIQRLQSDCTSSFTIFKPMTVCGQDPKACLKPASVPPNEWDKTTITKWPICQATINISVLDREDFRHMHCKITGRPCCIGTQAQCIITSQDYCRFRGGIYHPEKTLCSQVNCFTSTCGLLPFADDDTPDQFYRLWLSLFLNAGLFHVVLILIFNFTILRDIEKMAGWLRTSLIFILSGIGGNLWSCILVPYEPEVGASGAAFGIIACLFVELLNIWQAIKNPLKALAKLIGIVLILFLLGLLPYIDNFAHIFGFMYGFLLSMIFLPYVTFGNWDRRRKQMQILLSSIAVLVISTIGFILFYNIQTVSSSGITYFNCIPITESFCKNFHQGQYLEPRLTNY